MAKKIDHDSSRHNIRRPGRQQFTRIVAEILYVRSRNQKSRLGRQWADGVIPAHQTASPASTLSSQDCHRLSTPSTRPEPPHPSHYWDSLRLLLQFVAEKNGDPSQITPEDLTMERVSTFLQYLETGRRNQSSTRNVRLRRHPQQHHVRRQPTKTYRLIERKTTPRRYPSIRAPLTTQMGGTLPDRQPGTKTFFRWVECPQMQKQATTRSLSMQLEPFLANIDHLEIGR